MIYRIDIQNFLLHAIDHFSFVDLTYCKYFIVSEEIKCGYGDSFCTRVNMLFPAADTKIRYAATGDVNQLEREMMKMYNDMMTKDQTHAFYNTFLVAVKHHMNGFIISDRSENVFIDILCKFLKKQFALEVIDLNKLFTTGKLDKIHYDYHEIVHRSKDLKVLAKLDELGATASTEDGRKFLIEEKFDRKTKIQLCKNMGIKVDKDISRKDLDDILMEYFVKGDTVEDGN